MGWRCCGISGGGHCSGIPGRCYCKIFEGGGRCCGISREDVVEEYLVGVLVEYLVGVVLEHLSALLWNIMGWGVC